MTKLLLVLIGTLAFVQIANAAPAAPTLPKEITGTWCEIGEVPHKSNSLPTGVRFIKANLINSPICAKSEGSKGSRCAFWIGERGWTLDTQACWLKAIAPAQESYKGYFGNADCPGIGQPFGDGVLNLNINMD